MNIAEALILAPESSSFSYEFVTFEFRYWPGSVWCCDRRGWCRDGYFGLSFELSVAYQRLASSA